MTPAMLAMLTMLPLPLAAIPGASAATTHERSADVAGEEGIETLDVELRRGAEGVRARRC